MNAVSRITKELKDIKNKPPVGISVGEKKDNLYEWDAAIIGPSETPYDGAVFCLKIIFPKNYPFAAPKVSFVTPIYHCNVYKGNICLDILKDSWSPALTIEKVLLSISSLLAEPNPRDPLSPDIARLLIDNKLEHDRRAREFTIKYAINK
jgi:ubiquitin-conjugating enzyme E2 D/E